MEAEEAVVEAMVEAMLEAVVEAMVEAMLESMGEAMEEAAEAVVEAMVEAMLEAVVEATVEAMEEAAEAEVELEAGTMEVQAGSMVFRMKAANSLVFTSLKEPVLLAIIAKTITMYQEEQKQMEMASEVKEDLARIHQMDNKYKINSD